MAVLSALPLDGFKMPNVYLYRQTLEGRNRVADLLAQGNIAIGWSKLDKAIVLNPAVTKEDISSGLVACYQNLVAEKKITNGVNQLWRFLRELKSGDVVIAPNGDDIHFALIAGDPIYVEGRDDDTSIRRPVVQHPRSPVQRDDLPEEIRRKLSFRGHASFDLEVIKHDVFAFLEIELEDAADEADALEAEYLLMEAQGSYVISVKNELIVNRKHADVSEALVEHLRERGLVVRNTRTHGLAPDLYTKGNRDPMLFEIKTGNGSGDYLKALGQLLFYEKVRGCSYRKYLVLPPGIKDRVVPVLNSFDISIIEYTELNGRFTFSWPCS